MLEKHEDDKMGYDVLFVDPKYKGTFTGRLSHSCDPNCITTVINAGGKYAIGVYTIRPIAKGEEITFDYFCRTDDPEEMKAAICLWYFVY